MDWSAAFVPRNLVEDLPSAKRQADALAISPLRESGSIMYRGVVLSLAIQTRVKSTIFMEKRLPVGPKVRDCYDIEEIDAFVRHAA